jgi:Flp pilus assembly protein TadG
MQMLRDERGQTTILMTVIMATFLFGFIAMGVDVEYLFRAKRMAQAAADAAAVAAAEEYGSSTNEQNAANAMAKFNGFDTTLATNPAVVTITPEQYSNYDGTTASLVQNSYVTVKVSQPIRTFFMGMLKAGGTVTVSATATAGGGLSSPTCVCLEGTSGMDLNLSNNAKFTASGCGTTVNSSSSNAVGVVGSATLTSAVLGTVSSTWDNSSNINNAGTISSSTHVVLGISNGCSPTLPVVPSYSASACTADPLTHYGNGGSSYSVGPNSNASYSTTQGGDLVCYTSLTVGTNGDKVNLNPGIYVISGGSLHFESGANNASNTGGAGVFFYLTNGASLTIDNGANVNLTAMTSGAYANTLIFEDPSDTNAISIQGGSATSFNGAIYAPSDVVTLGNGSGTTISADLVAKSLTMNGGGTLASSATSNFGTLDLSTAKLTQ